jgi:hypothetical protein
VAELARRWECEKCENVLETPAPTPEPEIPCPVCSSWDAWEAADEPDGPSFPLALAVLAAVFLTLGFVRFD